MLLSLFARRAAICFCWGLFLGIPAAVFAQTNYYTTNGTEYAIIGSLPGDQVFPDVAVTPSGGFVVWQDNITDGSGWGVSATRLDSTLSGTLGTFRVNVQGTNDQENPRVALLKNGGAVFVWQGGTAGLPADLRAVSYPHQYLADDQRRAGEFAVNHKRIVFIVTPPTPPRPLVTNYGASAKQPYTTNTTTTVTTTVTTNVTLSGIFKSTPPWPR